MSYSAISIKGGKPIVKALRRIAMQKSLSEGRKVTVGELVYNAVYNTYKTEVIEAFSFFEEDVHSSEHMNS